ncbi:MAG: glycosyltransferase [Planctomycetota bacterium]|nr:glycosyltransferase [Planctomycetota bacterium]
MSNQMLAFLPIYNRAEMTVQFISRLQDILDSQIKLTVFLLDAGSTDNVFEKVQQLDANIKFIQLDDSYFWGKSMNKIIEIVKNESVPNDCLIGIFNNDTLQFERPLQRGIELLDRYDVMAPLSLEIDHRFKEPVETGETVSFKDLISQFSADIDYGMQFDKLRGRFVNRSPNQTPNVSQTLGTLARAKVLRSLPDSLIPPEIPHYLSDYYLTYSLTQMNYQLAIDPDYFVVRFYNPDDKKLPTEPDVARRESYNPQSRTYRPAMIRFREDFSKEPGLRTKILLKKAHYQLHRLLKRAS